MYVDNKVIDADGFRPNVGIILANDKGRLLWARRVGQDAWQFPQGGIGKGESPIFLLPHHDTAGPSECDGSARLIDHKPL